MKRCGHTDWLRLSASGNEVALFESDRLQTLINQIPDPDAKKPSLIVLIGGAGKSLALRKLFGVKRVRWFKGKPNPGEVHLHLDPSSIFGPKPLLLADVEFPKYGLKGKAIKIESCHETTRRTIRRVGHSLNDIADGIYTHLLYPFVDLFCFFSSDLGGFRQTARQIAGWLEIGTSSTLPRCTYPRIVIVSDRVPSESAEGARKAFLWMLREETGKDPFEQISALDIVPLFPAGSLSIEARHRVLKERLMDGLDQMRSVR